MTPVGPTEFGGHQCLCERSVQEPACLPQAMTPLKFPEDLVGFYEEMENRCAFWDEPSSLTGQPLFCPSRLLQCHP